MKIAWINARATARGGAERYVVDTAAHLRDEHGATSFLFYDVRSRVDARTSASFEGVFPLVETRAQLEDLRPDVVFVHQLDDERMLGEIMASGLPVVRFLHDHRLLCLREHKYTTVGKRPCAAAPGVGCYGCLGFARRDAARGVSLLSLGELRARVARHAGMEVVLVGSRYMREQAVLAGFHADRVVVVPLGTDEVEVDATERDPGLLLFAGALTTGKGVDVLLDALARVRTPARLVLAGDGPQRAELEELARARRVEDRVSFAGAVDARALDALYRRAACLVLPSRQPESFGLVGIEAMSHGLPVVASGLGGVSEWLVHGKNGLAVPPLDAAALAAALDRIVGDPAGARALGEEGRRMQHTHFTRRLHGARLLRVLEGASAKRRAA